MDDKFHTLSKNNICTIWKVLNECYWWQWDVSRTMGNGKSYNPCSKYDFTITEDDVSSKDQTIHVFCFCYIHMSKTGLNSYLSVWLSYKTQTTASINRAERPFSQWFSACIIIFAFQQKIINSWLRSWRETELGQPCDFKIIVTQKL